MIHRIDEANDARLDALLNQISNFVDGWDCRDIANVSAALTVMAICTTYSDSETRIKCLEEIIAFMHGILADIERKGVRLFDA